MTDRKLVGPGQQQAGPAPSSDSAGSRKGDRNRLPTQGPTQRSGPGADRQLQQGRTEPGWSHSALPAALDQQVSLHYQGILGNQLVQGALTKSAPDALDVTLMSDLCLSTVGVQGDLMGGQTTSNQAIARLLAASRQAQEPASTGSGRAQDAVGQALRRSGRPLPQPLKSQLEAQHGVSLDAVRVFDDGGGYAAAEAIHAKAFTVGTDVVMGRGAWQPNASAGQELIAHEVTHAVQFLQGRAGRASDSEDGVPVTLPSDAVEREATELGRTFAQGDIDTASTADLTTDALTADTLAAATAGADTPVARSTEDAPGAAAQATSEDEVAAEDAGLPLPKALAPLDVDELDLDHDAAKAKLKEELEVAMYDLLLQDAFAELVHAQGSGKKRGDQGTASEKTNDQEQDASDATAADECSTERDVDDLTAELYEADAYQLLTRMWGRSLAETQTDVGGLLTECFEEVANEGKVFSGAAELDAWAQVWPLIQQDAEIDEDAAEALLLDEEGFGGELPVVLSELLDTGDDSAPDMETCPPEGASLDVPDLIYEPPECAPAELDQGPTSTVDEHRPATPAVDFITDLSDADLTAFEAANDVALGVCLPPEAMSWDRVEDIATTVGSGALAPFAQGFIKNGAQTLVLDAAGTWGDDFAIAALRARGVAPAGAKAPLIGPLIQLTLDGSSLYQHGVGGDEGYGKDFVSASADLTAFRAEFAESWDAGLSEDGAAHYFAALSSAMTGWGDFLNGLSAVCSTASAAIFIIAFVLSCTVAAAPAGAIAASVATSLAAASVVLGVMAMELAAYSLAMAAVAAWLIPEDSYDEQMTMVSQRTTVLSAAVGEQTGGAAASAGQAGFAEWKKRSPETETKVTCTDDGSGVGLAEAKTEEITTANDADVAALQAHEAAVEAAVDAAADTTAHDGPTEPAHSGPDPAGNSKLRRSAQAAAQTFVAKLSGVEDLTTSVDTATTAMRRTRQSLEAKFPSLATRSAHYQAARQATADIRRVHEDVTALRSDLETLHTQSEAVKKKLDEARVGDVGIDMEDDGSFVTLLSQLNMRQGQLERTERQLQTAQSELVDLDLTLRRAEQAAQALPADPNLPPTGFGGTYRAALSTLAGLVSATSSTQSEASSTGAELVQLRAMIDRPSSGSGDSETDTCPAPEEDAAEAYWSAHGDELALMLDQATSQRPAMLEQLAAGPDVSVVDLVYAAKEASIESDDFLADYSFAYAAGTFEAGAQAELTNTETGELQTAMLTDATDQVDLAVQHGEEAAAQRSESFGAAEAALTKANSSAPSEDIGSLLGDASGALGEHGELIIGSPDELPEPENSAEDATSAAQDGLDKARAQVGDDSGPLATRAGQVEATRTQLGTCMQDLQVTAATNTEARDEAAAERSAKEASAEAHRTAAEAHAEEVGSGVVLLEQWQRKKVRLLETAAGSPGAGGGTE